MDIQRFIGTNLMHFKHRCVFHAFLATWSDYRDFQLFFGMSRDDRDGGGWTINQKRHPHHLWPTFSILFRWFLLKLGLGTAAQKSSSIRFRVPSPAPRAGEAAWAMPQFSLEQVRSIMDQTEKIRSFAHGFAVQSWSKLGMIGLYIYIYTHNKCWCNFTKFPWEKQQRY